MYVTAENETAGVAVAVAVGRMSDAKGSSALELLLLEPFSESAAPAARTERGGARPCSEWCGSVTLAGDGVERSSSVLRSIVCACGGGGWYCCSWYAPGPGCSGGRRLPDTEEEAALVRFETATDTRTLESALDKPLGTEPGPGGAGVGEEDSNAESARDEDDADDEDIKLDVEMDEVERPLDPGPEVGRSITEPSLEADARTVRP